jgi:hypothetical protein
MPNWVKKISDAVNPVNVDNITQLGITKIMQNPTQGAEEDYFGPTLDDGTYLYQAIDSSGTYNSRVLALDYDTLEVLFEWDSGTTEQIGCLHSDGSYLYVGFLTYPGTVYQIDLGTFTLTATWTGAIGEDSVQGIDDDGTYIYVSLETDPAQVKKIDIATMATTATWTGAVGQNVAGNVSKLGIGDSIIYVALGNTSPDPTQVVQINRATMTTVATWTGAVGQEGGRSLKNDFTYLYLGLTTATYPQIIKIDPSTMTELDTWTGNDDMRIVSFIFTYGESVFAIIKDNFDLKFWLIIIDTANMTELNTWIAPPDMLRCYGAASGADTFYLALGILPGKLIVLNTIATMSLALINEIAAYDVTLKNKVGYQQLEVPVSIDAINASETDFLNHQELYQTQTILDLVLKSADPGANTVNVKLYRKVNGVMTNTKTFAITTANYTTYFDLVSLFGQNQLVGDAFQITVQATAGGPYAITGSYTRKFGI